MPQNWLDPAVAELCALRGSPPSEGMTGYIAAVVAEGAGGGGAGPCTRVWTAGTLAYRCRTCGVSPASSICVACFQVR